MRRLLNADCMTCLMRADSGSTGTLLASYAFLASACSMNAVGGLTLMMFAPSCAAICAAYATTSSAVSPCLLMPDPRGYDQMTSGRPCALASSPIARASSYIDFSFADPG